MNQCPEFDYLLVVPHLHVQNANAISSPLTHGFPSMTAFLGFMWALERKAKAAGIDVDFNAIGTVCHDYQEQTADSGYIESLRLTRNPVDKHGNTAAIVEEGRIHLELSLILGVAVDEHWDDEKARQTEMDQLVAIIQRMRIAGGTVIPPEHAWRRQYESFVIDQTSSDSSDRRAQFRTARRRFLPGSTLVSRDDLLDKRHAELQATQPESSRLDAWLSLSRINWHYEPETEDVPGRWRHDRSGWIVPIPVGYGALGTIHDPGTVRNTRDKTTPFRFVEGLYSVGEWVGAHRIHCPEDMLWYADSRPEEDIYRCQNDYVTTT